MTGSVPSTPTRSKSRYKEQRAVSATKPGSDSQKPPASLTDAAVNIIRNNILDLTLTPGSWIDDKLLMQRFQLSRTPVREALNRLVAEGLVTIQKYKGAQVSPVDMEHIRQFFDAYIASERMNGYFCNTSHAGLVSDLDATEKLYESAANAGQFLEMTRLNAALHHRIAAATENIHLADFSARLQNISRRLTIFLMQIEAGIDIRPGDYQAAIRADHNAMIESIGHSDNIGLVRVLTSHAEQFHNRVTRAMGNTKASSFTPHDSA